MSNSKIQPLVSIIIPTKNTAQILSRCLKSIIRQTYNNIEIILVDNFSTDQTLGIARKFTNLVYSKGPERSAQRNYGAKNASGEYLLFLDSDMILGKTLITECVNKINQDSTLSALIIPEISIGKGFWAGCKTLEKKCYIGDDRIEGLRFINKKTFKKVGGFSDFISGEDWDFTQRVRAKGYRVGRIENVVHHNEGQLKLWDDLRKKYYYATKSLPYVNKHIKGPRDIIFFIFRPAFFRNWKILLDDPIHAWGLFFMKFCEFGVGFVGIIIAKINYAKRRL